MADALRDWLPSVIQSVEPFLSTEIDKGTRWSAEIGVQLDETSFGIICVTPENVSAPWLNFEAGALSKSIQGAQTHVVPLLLGFRTPTDLEPPLGQFQAALANQADMRRVIETINGFATPVLPEARLSVYFDRWWPDLENRLRAIEESADTPTATRSIGDKLDELLLVARQMMTRLDTRESDLGLGVGRSTLERKADSTQRRRAYQKIVNNVVRKLRLAPGTVIVGRASSDDVTINYRSDLGVAQFDRMAYEIAETFSRDYGRSVHIVFNPVDAGQAGTSSKGSS
jgi:hypothetical protein